MKKTISILVCCIMLFGTVPFGAFTAAASEIVKSGSCGESVTYTLDSDGLLTISGSGKIKKDQFRDNKSIKKVVIETGVTSIGASCFKECTGLTDVIIPDSVKLIDIFAFAGCTGLTSIILPESVEMIGRSAFVNCTGLTSITIPVSVIIIQECVFSGCEKLVISGVEGSYAQTYAESNDIPFSVVGTERVDPKIIQSGFCGKSVVYTLDSEGLLKIIGSGAMTDYLVPDYYYFPGDDLTPSRSPFNRDSSITGVIIQEGITSIGSGVFADCDRITGVVIPGSVTSINDGAFSGCTGLAEIIIPCSVTSIGGYAFSGCTALKKVIIPPSVTAIAADVVPEGATVIGAVGSYAEKWAEENKVKFESYTAGDVDGDGEILAGDARLALRVSAKLETAEDWQKALADMDGDDEIYAGDARIILRRSAKLPDD